MDCRDLRVQLVRDGPVARMTLATRAQLDQVHRLARVQIEDVSDPVAQAERVRRELGHAGVADALVLRRGALEPGAVVVGYTGLLELGGDAGAEVGTERLPLDREQAV